ncbi:MAG: hypothetical protein AAB152_04965 [Candidatus Coatesbacteria bacterium]
MAARVTAKRRGFAVRYTDAVQRRRDELCFGVWGIGFLVAWVRIWRDPDPVGVWDRFPRLFAGEWRPETPVAWICLLAGVGFRVWAAGNLEKNRFDRPKGPYRMVRHPLYLGTLLVSLAFFLSIGLPVTGLLLWVGLLAGVFLPVLRKEERELAGWFPGPYGRYRQLVPALVPDPRAVPAALASDVFTLERARRNFGLRALWFLLLVPALNVGLECWIWYRWHYPAA